MRSMLFVPGDRPERFEKAEASGADAVILDLEDAVAAAQRPKAREAITAHLKRSSRPVPLWVRINPIDSTDALIDLTAVVPARPDGILLPKARDGGDVLRLEHWLEALEAAHGLTADGIKVIPMITETAGAMLQLASFVPTPARVVGMTWGAEDLASELGAAASRDEAGMYDLPYQMASAGCLFTAAAAGVSAIDTVDTEIKDIAARSILRRFRLCMRRLRRAQPKWRMPKRCSRHSRSRLARVRSGSTASSSTARIGCRPKECWRLHAADEP